MIVIEVRRQWFVRESAQQWRRIEDQLGRDLQSAQRGMYRLFPQDRIYLGGR